MARTDRTGELFAAIDGAPAGASWFGGAAPASMLLHAAALSALLLAPLWAVLPAPKLARGQTGIVIYDPPAPPAPPLPPGDGTVTRTVRVQPRPEPAPELVTPLEPEAPVLVATLETPDAVPGGSPGGSERGVAEGEVYGRDGGMVGGLPDGVDGGLITGTRTGAYPVPVTGYQHKPVRIRVVEPVYPPEAFAKKIQGTVVVEMLIDVDGRVVRTQVTTSIPQLDAAAVEAVHQWRFTPAMKDGRPVPSLASAPVRFSIY